MLRSDGSYARVVPASGEAPVRAQSRFIELARERVKEGEAHIRASGRYQFVQVHPAAKSGAPEERRRRQTEKRNSTNQTPEPSADEFAGGLRSRGPPRSPDERQGS